MGTPKPPPPIIPQPPPTNDSASVIAAAEDLRQRMANAQGRSSTILPGTTDSLAANRGKTLLGA